MSIPGADVLADPRARWLIATLRLLYAELDPDAQPVGLSVVALSGGQIVTYGVNSWSSEVTRFVTDVGDLDVVAQAIESGSLGGVVTDATVRDGPP